MADADIARLEERQFEPDGEEFATSLGGRDQRQGRSAESTVGGMADGLPGKVDRMIVDQRALFEELVSGEGWDPWLALHASIIMAAEDELTDLYSEWVSKGYHLRRPWPRLGRKRLSQTIDKLEEDIDLMRHVFDPNHEIIPYIPRANLPGLVGR